MTEERMPPVTESITSVPVNKADLSCLPQPPSRLAQLIHALAGQLVNGLLILLFWALLAGVLLVLGTEWPDAIGYGFLLAFFGSFVFRSLVIHTLGPKFASRVPGLASYAPSVEHPVTSTESFREVVETVVFVVVLVLLLKSFVAEAFVIPTGSMAETLLGYQKMITCPSCRHRFPVNSSREVERSRNGQITFIHGCTCPNCRLRINLLRPDEAERRPPQDLASILDPGFVLPEWVPGAIRFFTNGPRSGDRVLVSKYPYDLPGMKPQRLDVVVFKFPGDDQDGPFPLTGPFKEQVPINYIKRLVGLPGETIAIHRGKLFVLPPELSPKYPEDDEARKDPSKAIQMWRSRGKDWLHHNDERARTLFDEGKFQILRKPAHVVLAMKRLVYDNDHPAKDLPGPNHVRWQPTRESAWSENAEQRAFICSGGPDMTWVRYQHVLRDAGGKPQLITDFMGYNSNVPNDSGEPGENWATDLILECQAQAEKPAGKLVLELSRGPSRFQAEFDFAANSCSLFRLRDGQKPQQLGSAPTPALSRGPVTLRFANVDDRLLVWVNEQLPFGQGVEYTVSPRLTPTAHNDLDRPASIGASGGRFTVRHLKLYRDTYYTVNSSLPDLPAHGQDGFNFGNPATFAAWSRAPVGTYYVQPGHYLCLGDNSVASSDGRTWGLVPERLMLGRAVMVYFPFTRFGPIR
ncbi:MAG: S26 family signal peptidase [Gemmataceae bacterium]